MGDSTPELDALAAMVGFLDLSPGCTYTDGDRQALKRDLGTIAQSVAQMDGGQRGRGVDFSTVGFVLTRIAANAMQMWRSGRLDGMEVDDG